MLLTTLPDFIWCNSQSRPNKFTTSEDGVTIPMCDKFCEVLELLWIAVGPFLHCKIYFAECFNLDMPFEKLCLLQQEMQCLTIIKLDLWDIGTLPFDLSSVRLHRYVNTLEQPVFTDFTMVPMPVKAAQIKAYSQNNEVIREKRCAYCRNWSGILNSIRW